MDLTIIIVLVGFVMFALTLIFLGVFKSRKKIVPKEIEELRDMVTAKPKKNVKPEKKERQKFLTNKIIVSSDVNKMQYHGSTPFIMIDENWQQMPLDRTVLQIPRETLTRMFPLAYLAGKLSVMEQGTKVGMVMILLFILVIANLGLTYWKTSNTDAQIKSTYDNSTSSINNIRTDVQNNIELTQLIAKKLDITENSTTQTVGG